MNPNEFSLLKMQSGLSTKELARVLGYSQSNIYRWERGEEVPRASALQALRALIGESNDDGSGHFTFIDLFAGMGIDLLRDRRLTSPP